MLRVRAILFTFLAALATGLLLTLALPLGEEGFLIWVALVPLLWAVRGRGLLLGFLGGLGAVFFAAWISTTGLLYRHPDPSADPVWVYGSFGKYGMSFAVALAVWGEPGTARWPTWLFAALGVLLEAAQLLQLPSHLALALYRHAGMVQLASLGGIWLVSFLVWWANFAVAEWLRGERKILPRRLWPAGLAVAVFFATQNAWLPFNGAVRRFAAVQTGELEEENLVRYQAEATRAGASLVVWPEVAGNAMSFQGNTSELQTLSASSAPFVTSFQDDYEPPHNTAAVFSGGSESARYHKRRLFGDESKMHASGDRAVAAGDVGLNICFDSCFPSVIRDTARLNPAVVALPTIDPPSANRFLAAVHAAYTPFRAAENGVAMVRADGYAYSMIVDPCGRIVAEALPGERLLLADSPVGPRWTLCKALGDWFLWVCGGLFVLGILRVRRVSRAERRISSAPL